MPKYDVHVTKYFLMPNHFKKMQISGKWH